MADSLTFTKDEGYKMKNSSQGENLLRLLFFFLLSENKVTGSNTLFGELYCFCVNKISRKVGHVDCRNDFSDTL